MTEQAQPKNTPEREIANQALIWRAIDRTAVGTRHDSPERKAEYTARQQLRDVIDRAAKENR